MTRWRGVAWVAVVIADVGLLEWAIIARFTRIVRQ